MYTIKSFNTGQITLPKKWRSKYPTKHYIAEETEEGLLIKPLLYESSKDEVIYYENKEGFGVYSNSGMDPEDIISSIQALHHG